MCSPFAEIEGSGMEVAKKINPIGEKPNQGQIQSRGNAYLDSSFPQLSKIISAKVIADGDEM